MKRVWSWRHISAGSHPRLMLVLNIYVAATIRVLYYSELTRKVKIY